VWSVSTIIIHIMLLMLTWLLFIQSKMHIIMSIWLWAWFSDNKLMYCNSRFHAVKLFENVIKIQSIFNARYYFVSYRHSICFSLFIFSWLMLRLFKLAQKVFKNKVKNNLGKLTNQFIWYSTNGFIISILDIFNNLSISVFSFRII
jgi:hypothetical protein